MNMGSRCKRSGTFVLLVFGSALATGCGDGSQERPGPEAAREQVVEQAAWFREEARERGLVFEHVSGHDGERYLFPEIMGGGAALLDVDADGDLDAYLVQSGILDGANEATNRLFANDGAGRFSDVTETSGSGDAGYGMGVATGDLDGDGSTDLFVTNLGPNTLLRNDGGGRFRADADRRGADDGSWSTSAAVFDADADGDLDVFVTNYVHWSLAEELSCSAVPYGADYCSPLSYENPAPDVLLRNDGTGRFVDGSAEAGLRTSFGNGLGVATGDFDGDGLLDVFVANDGMVNQLWHNLGDGAFVDRAAQRGCAVDQNGRTKAGMGVECLDLDGDLDEDLLVVNLHGESDSYYRNEGTFFSDRTPTIGLATPSKPFTRFGVVAADFDCDGWLDLYEANGRVTKSTEPGEWGFFAEPNLLFRGRPVGGATRFEEQLPRGGTPELLVQTSRALAVGDVDGDGALDLLIGNRDGPAQLLRNVAAGTEPGGSAWIAFDVREASGGVALGAGLVLTVGEQQLFRRVRSAHSYLSASDPTVHVGLGAATGVQRVEVRWTDGTRESFGPFDASALGTRIRLQRGG